MKTDMDVREVNFSQIEVPFIPKQIFEKFIGLESLAIDLANLEEIEPGCFAQATNLRYIYANRNKLQKLENNCFAGAKNMTYINLEDNQIKIIDSSAFDGLQNLEYLNLNNNKLTTIEYGTICCLHNFKQFLLRNNTITVLNKYIFSTLKSLKILDLSKNKCINETIENFSGNFSDLESKIDAQCSKNHFNDLLIKKLFIELQKSKVENGDLEQLINFTIASNISKGCGQWKTMMIVSTGMHIFGMICFISLAVATASFVQKFR